MEKTTTSFGIFAWRLIALHTVTYFLAGMVAVSLFDYEHLFASEGLAGFMRPTTDPVTALGPGLQWLRGLIFAVALWPFREVFLPPVRGWLRLWLLFVGLGILATFGPAPGSVDGFIYTRVPPATQVMFMPELLVQSLLLSAGLWGWYRKPVKVLNWIAAVLLALVFLMSIAGYQFLGMDV
jgi:hypothetical protein